MIHAYQLNGCNIVLDVYSGAVHLVDEIAFEVIKAVDAGTPREEIVRDHAARFGVSAEEITELLAEIDELAAAGKLFTKDIYADKAFDYKNRSTVVKALCLHVAHTCNLTCNYCFAAQGKFHGDRALMSFEVGKRALDFLVENSGTRKNLEVDFFGGDPLMNWDVVKQLVA